ncbi:carbohydrate kinase family protein [Martelella mediterranea]|uniref:Fructokinase n=1 Tax=Martelella mediterranea TaxID=293089 RepID=A0A4R3NJW9_9HYPH|nr:carbohydrate kinase [Martelella mediterranea]TCT33058.1 fructokinase [Martelella mediterranea]
MILCCGEALIDMIPEATLSGQSGFVPHVGGAVFNTAIALGRIGADVALLAGLSSDLFGRQLIDALHKSKVLTSFASIRDLPTTLAFVQLSNGHAHYDFFDENTAGRMLLPVDLPSELPETVTTLFFGGISLVTEPCADTFTAFAEKHAGQRLVMVDPNIRPGFIRDEPAYRKRLARLIAIADIVKVSDEDLEWLYPGQLGLEAKCRKLRADGPSVVLVTRGSKGATAIAGAAIRLDLPARAVAMIDTVGAGDTFNAGFLAGLSEIGVTTKSALGSMDSHRFAHAVELGIRAAAITVSRAGANPPWREELTLQPAALQT